MQGWLPTDSHRVCLGPDESGNGKTSGTPGSARGSGVRRTLDRPEHPKRIEPRPTREAAAESFRLHERSVEPETKIGGSTFSL